MINFPIDYVFPYVNNFDQIWRQNYEKYCIQTKQRGRIDNIDGERYRDNGCLPFVFRSIEKHAPFINNIFLIVSNKEQVPKWLDKTKVKIILHEDFIPQEYLPTYNSCTIEMFLPDIPGLSDHFIYGNDDMYFGADVTPEDYFTNKGLPKLSMNTWNATRDNSQYWSVCHNLYNQLVTKLELTPLENGGFIVPIHGFTPVNKQLAVKARKFLWEDIEPNITNFRTNSNYNQYIYSEYAYLTDKFEESQRTVSYLAIERKRINRIIDALISAKNQEVVINDTEKTTSSDLRFISTFMKKNLLKIYPNKSIYEIMDGVK